MNQPVVEIREKEIRGITLKSLIWAFSVVIAGLIAGVMGYSQMINKLEKATESVQDLKKDVKDLQTQFRTFEIKIVRMETERNTPIKQNQ